MFIAGPLGYAFWLSFHQANPLYGAFKFIGLQGYFETFASSDFSASLMRTFLFTLVNVSLVVAVGLVIALFLNKNILGIKLLRALLLIPWAIPPSIAAMLFILIYSPGKMGLLNGALSYFGFIDEPIAWLGKPTLAFFSVCGLYVWQQFPLVAIVFLAGLQSIPVEIPEAAKIDGASSLQLFWYIITPSLLPFLGIILIIQTMLAFNFFTHPYVLTRGGPGDATTPLSLFVYFNSFQFLNFGRACRGAVLMTAIILVFAYFYAKTLFRR